MRAYFFVNSALSGIQKGLQSGHCGDEIALKAVLGSRGSDRERQFYEAWLDWVSNHKTVILLEGGFHQNLAEIEDFFKDIIHEHPWAAFREDEETLALAYTCVGIILPERIYEAAKRVREARVNLELGLDDERVWSVVGEFKITEWEAKLIQLLNSCPLAR